MKYLFQTRSVCSMRVVFGAHSIRVIDTSNACETVDNVHYEPIDINSKFNEKLAKKWITCFCEFFLFLLLTNNFRATFIYLHIEGILLFMSCVFLAFYKIS